MDPTFDVPEDRDGDGLPDRYEVQIGTDPDKADTDGDGWVDGPKNRRTFLLLERIEALDEGEDIGKDEIYLVSEDVRFPQSFKLDGYWPMNHGTVITPNVIIDKRVSPSTGALSFKSRIKLREADVTVFEHPFDDTYGSLDLTWTGERGTHVWEVKSDDYHYRLHFRWFTLFFADPNPTDPNGDSDGDGLTEQLEFKISTQDPSLRPIGVPRIEGYDGLADPGQRELFVEIDALGASEALKEDAKIMVASQFYYHGITPRFDDGYLGGGQV